MFVEPEVDLAALPALEQVTRLKNGLVARAQNGEFEGGDAAYRTLRRAVRSDPSIDAKLPNFVKTCGNVGEFWGYIQASFPT